MMTDTGGGRNGNSILCLNHLVPMQNLWLSMTSPAQCSYFGLPDVAITVTPIRVLNLKWSSIVDIIGNFSAFLNLSCVMKHPRFNSGSFQAFLYKEKESLKCDCDKVLVITEKTSTTTWIIDLTVKWCGSHPVLVQKWRYFRYGI